jgi:hypothetical protein
MPRNHVDGALVGKSLEDCKSWSATGLECNETNQMFRMMVAKVWADTVEGEAGPDFSAAVRLRLTESPNISDGDQWRQDLAHKVILPLQNCCDWVRGEPADLSNTSPVLAFIQAFAGLDLPSSRCRSHLPADLETPRHRHQRPHRKLGSRSDRGPRRCRNQH